MSPAELRELGEDIVKNGLTSAIVLWRADPKGQAQLLDGRNRLDAIEMVIGSPAAVGAPSIMAGERFLACNKVIVLDRSTDPHIYAVSANIHRRHLTAEKKHEIIVALLKATPGRSNNATAKIAKVDDKTVATVRADLERRSEIPNVSTRIDTKGRTQPAKKFKKATDSPPNVSEEVLQQRDAAAERIRALRGGPKLHDDSSGESERLQCENIDLRSEIEDAKTGARSNVVSDLIENLIKNDDLCLTVVACVAAVIARVDKALATTIDAEQRKRLFACLRAALDDLHYVHDENVAAPNDDGLDIPACLRRRVS
jgi:hypothetical protein